MPAIADIAKLAAAEHGDPFAFLGRHRSGRGEVARCFIPRARAAWLEDENRSMERFPDSDLFEYHGDCSRLPNHPLILWDSDEGQRKSCVDPYSFAPALDPQAMQSFQDGTHYRAQEMLGAHGAVLDGVAGTLFAVWAPAAHRVSVVGDFNHWDGRCHPMRLHPAWGIWELFIPGLESGAYKFEIRTAGGDVVLKSDPFARHAELRPATASLVPAPARHQWHDAHWLHQRERTDWLARPVAVYEAHLGSWRRHADGSFLPYREMAAQLCQHVRSLGFTHIELMPLNEHPLDESWGYQSTGYFAPTSRHGNPDDFRAFVDHCHQQGIGVILDWVPAHFPRDAHALAAFDGTALFEYPDPWKAEQRDWGTLVFNYERTEVRSFLISSALYWLREFHLDGLRVDAVASMLYLNFSRQAEQWAPNKFGGHHNLEAIEFIRELNQAVRRECPGCLMVAEESSDWHGVTYPVESGGLGFHLKWNMGWMHDTLNYLGKDPIHRKHHHYWLTFGPVYAFDENFILPLSHDEVVHLKKSLFGRMPGDEWQHYANLRLLYSYQWCYPGKKLLFMGGEFAQASEWDAGAGLPWSRAEEPMARGIGRLLTRLNLLLAAHPALSQYDGDARGFEWLDGEDEQQSVICFVRHGAGDSLVVVLNFTPEPRLDYRIPVHQAGRYQERFNSDAAEFGGSGNYPALELNSEPVEHRGRPHSLRLDLPPLAAVVLEVARVG
ncbi:MAG TPA: 1,4-alpha-glucan branching protein GlgB [Xanthomonadales bacterium]|nr:1,4-alpha-glucan branching protein GlgB [Xanthomonadales bacterium]